jgi:hypothetical protein
MFLGRMVVSRDAIRVERGVRLVDEGGFGRNIEGKINLYVGFLWRLQVL